MWSQLIFFMHKCGDGTFLLHDSGSGNLLDNEWTIVLFFTLFTEPKVNYLPVNVVQKILHSQKQQQQ